MKILGIRKILEPERNLLGVGNLASMNADVKEEDG
jgi:hypothetical protein